MSKAIISCWSTTYWTCRTCSSACYDIGSRWRVKRAAGYASRRRQGSHRPVDYGQAAAGHVRQAPAISPEMLIAGSSLPGRRQPMSSSMRAAPIASTGAGWQPDRRHHGVLKSHDHAKPKNPATYFWHHARNYRLDDPDLTEFLANAASTAFGEDVDILAAQQRSIDSAKAEWRGIDINADAGVLQARRVIDKMLAAE